MGTIRTRLLARSDEIPDQLVPFIRTTVLEDFRKKGTVIGVSGGIDSAVVLALAVRALGKDRVMAMLLPEKESSPASRELGLRLIARYGVEYREVPITPILEACGVYSRKFALIQRLYPGFDPAIHQTSLFLPPDVLHDSSLNIPRIRIMQEGTMVAEKRLHARDVLEVMSLQNVKQRSRMMVQYMLAEQNNFTVCGTTNKTEMVTGHFVKYGDGGVDLEPLADCYKTQVYAIAHLLGIEPEIISRPPSPDTWSNFVSDMDFYWRMPYEILDELLYAEEKGYSLEMMEESTGIPRDTLRRAMQHIQGMKAIAQYLTRVPPVYRLPSD